MALRLTVRELMEHELSWYKGIARLKLLGFWRVKLLGKPLTVVVYKATPRKDAKMPSYTPGAEPPQYRFAVSHGERILTSQIIERPPRKGKK